MALYGHMDKESYALAVTIILVATFSIFSPDPLHAEEWATLQQKEVIVSFEDSLIKYMNGRSRVTLTTNGVALYW